MLLREPDGSCSQLFGNGNNIADQQQSQRTWIDKTIVPDPNTNTVIAENESDTNNLSLTCRENQLREALAKSLELNVNNSLNYNNNYQSDDLSKLESYELSSNFVKDTTISSAILDYSPDEGLFDYEEEEHSFSSSSTSGLEYDDKVLNSGSDDSFSNDSLSYHIPRGIHNPNYPGFQHLAYTLQEYLIETPSPSENFDLSFYQNEHTNKLIDKLEESSNFIENEDFKHAIEKNNNNIAIEDSLTISQETKIDEVLSESIDTSKLSLNDNILPTETENVYNQPDKNDNILPSVLESSKDPCFPDSEILNESKIDSKYLSMDENINQNIQDDFIELKKDIYEIIQKPIATTLHNISDVVNNVIRYIAEHDENSEFLKIPFDESYQKFIEEAKQKVRASEATENNNSENLSNVKNCNENSLINQETRPEEILEGLKMQMDDAYMSNVSENLFIQKNSDVETALKIIESNMYDINFNKENDVTKIVSSKSNEEIAPGNIKNHKHPERCPSLHTFRYDSKNDKDRITTESTKENKPHKKINRKKLAKDGSGEFDVYNIETAMPSIDLDAIENHLRAAREEERRRRNDREEIRRRLAMGTEQDEYYLMGDRPGRKPSLQARLQSGMNLQICFMNETASDTESPCDIEVNNLSDQLKTVKNSKYKNDKSKFVNINCIKTNNDTRKMRPNSLALNNSTKCVPSSDLTDQIDFFECQARLQTEARMALAQAKEIARMQMEIERQQQEKSPITEMLRSSLEKAGVQFLGDRRRVSRQMLTDINITQLQVIVNELHTQIEFLNESLVELLIARDELHMGQDSMLVDIEDLTRHLGAKDLMHKTADSNEKHALFGKNSQFNTPALPDFPSK